MKTLRPYQNAAEISLFKYVNERDGNPLIVAPVAAGKSLMIAEFIRKVHELYPRTRIVMLTHVKELLEQNRAELFEQYPDADVGYYCAGLGQKRLHNDITFASIQSVHSKAMEFNRAPQIIIIDECHLISHKATTQYRKFIDEVLSINPNCKVIGYTGTPFRADTGRLDEGENALFDDIAYEIGMDYMIEQGYWAKPVCPHIATKMDVSSVSVRGGDYAAGELERAVNTQEVTDECVKEMLELGKGRRKWLVFTAGIQHCEDVAMEIHTAGITVAHITSKTPTQERIDNIERFRRGEIQCLVNVAVLTTGFAASQRYCYSCSYCFIDLSNSAANKAVVSMDEPAEWVEVLGMFTSLHQNIHKEGSVPTLKVTYATLRDSIREWVCFEHHKYPVGDNRRYAWDQAVKWHNKRLPNTPVPNKVFEVATEIEYPRPHKILIKKDGKYWKIMDYDFSQAPQAEEEFIEDDEFLIPF